MRLIVLVFSFFFLGSSCYSQDLKDFVLTKSHQDGTLYHVKEMELETDAKKSDLLIDFTFLNTPAEDTVRVLMTFLNRDVKGQPSALSLRFGDKELMWSEDQVDLLYVDRVKKEWATRVEVKMDEAVFKSLIESAAFHVKWQTESFSCKAVLPKKYAESFALFAELIKYNN
jgi:hypothetical protein